MATSPKPAAKNGRELRVNLRKGTGEYTSVTLRNVQVEVTTPTAAQLKKGVATSKRVFTALSQVVPKKGVKLKLPESVPTYSADPRGSDYVVRKVGNTQTLGRFASNGRFVAVKG